MTGSLAFTCYLLGVFLHGCCCCGITGRKLCTSTFPSFSMGFVKWCGKLICLQEHLTVTTITPHSQFTSHFLSFQFSVPSLPALVPIFPSLQPKNLLLLSFLFSLSQSNPFSVSGPPSIQLLPPSLPVLIPLFSVPSVFSPSSLSLVTQYTPFTLYGNISQFRPWLSVSFSSFPFLSLFPSPFPPCSCPHFLPVGTEFAVFQITFKIRESMMNFEG